MGKTIHAFGLLNRLESQSYVFNPLLSREYPSLELVSFTYTPNGNLQDVTETKRTSATSTATEQTHRDFDALERMALQRRDYGSTQKSIAFGYDTKGNRTTVTDFTGASTVYQYDSVDRVKTASMPSGAVAINYWPDGLPKSATYSAGSVAVTQQRCYDDAGRLKSLVSAVGAMNDDCSMPGGSSTLRRFDYFYDANGNRTRLDETLGGAPSEVSEYGLDELDRLVATVEGSEAKLYRLDAVGNRTGEKKTTAAAARALGLTAAAFLALAPADTLASVQASFNRADWLLSRTQLVPVTGGGTTDFEHDANGNLTLEDGPAGTREYKWDARNTLTVAFVDGVERGRYSYNWQKERVGRSTAAASTGYVLDGRHVLVEVDDGQPARPATRRYHYGAKSPLAVNDVGGARWLLNDVLGSVSDEVLATGSLHRQRQYGAWGEYRNGTAPNGTDIKTGYAGYQFDDETGLEYSQGPRYYDPRFGVWLQRDDLEGELQNAPSLHRYNFNFVNPLRFVDPSGYAGEQATPTDTCHSKYGPGCEEIPGGQGMGPRPTGRPPPELPPEPPTVPGVPGASASTWTLFKIAVGVGLGAGAVIAPTVTPDEVDRTIMRVGPSECARGNAGACEAVQAVQERRPDLKLPGQGDTTVREAPGAAGTEKKAPGIEKGNVSAPGAGDSRVVLQDPKDEDLQMEFGGRYVGDRDEQGKFISPTGKRGRPGAEAEKDTWDELERKGYEVVRQGVRVVDEDGNVRVYDGLARKKGSDKWLGIETKQGTGRRTPEQREFDEGVTPKTPVTPVNEEVSERAPKVEGVLDVKVPAKGRPVIIEKKQQKP